MSCTDKNDSKKFPNHSIRDLKIDDAMSIYLNNKTVGNLAAINNCLKLILVICKHAI